MAQILNILLADDDKDDCLFFADILSTLPLETSLQIAMDGQQFISQLEKESAILPDLIFLDLNMPRKNGYECLAEIKSHTQFNTIPVIIFSTSFDQEKANQLYDNGAHYYICKPANFQDLQCAVHSAIQRVQLNNERPLKQDFLISKPKSILL